MPDMPSSCYYTKLSPIKIAIADVCEYYDLGWIITRINVPKEFRGKGEGTRLLKKVTDDADKHGVTLWLEISPSGGLTWEELEKWYKRHGFVWKGYPSIMRRKPNLLTGESR